MVGFDLSEILVSSGLSVSSTQIQDLLYHLSMQTSGYLANVQNMRSGVKPSEGQYVSNLPSAELTANFVNQTILREQDDANIYLSKIYSDQIFQVMVASGYIPVAWLQKTYPFDADVMFNVIKNLWDAMLTDYAGMKTRRDLIYTHFKSFGMFTCRMPGYENDKLLYFVMPHSQADASFLTRWIADNKIHEVLVLDDQNYAAKLVDKNYNFLFKFDKIVDVYKGITFRVSTELKATVPVYMAQIGCDHMCYFPDKKDSDNYIVTSNRFNIQEFQRGESIQVTVALPTNYQISFVCINGVPHFFGTADMEAAGIMLTEIDSGLVTSYKTVNVTISGLRESSKIYIDACEDLTGKRTTKKMISTVHSMVEFGEEDTKIRVTFNQPFIFFNTEKVKVYARKNEDSDEELIESVDVLVDGFQLVEKQMVFGEAYLDKTSLADDLLLNMERPSEPLYGTPQTNNSSKMGYMLGQFGLPLDSPSNPDPMKRHDNPYIISHLPKTGSPQYRQNASMEAGPESRAILFNVNEAGSIIITFDGYTNYKYFRVTFDDRAMIVVYRVAGSQNDIDVIPVVEDYLITNPNYVEETEEDNTATGDTDENSDGESTGDNSGSTTDEPSGKDDSSKTDNSEGESGTDNSSTEEPVPDTTGDD